VLLILRIEVLLSLLNIVTSRSFSTFELALQWHKNYWGHSVKVALNLAFCCRFLTAPPRRCPSTEIYDISTESGA